MIPDNSRLVLELVELQKLLHESLQWITEKPWDDSTLLHARISKHLGLPIKYKDYIDKMEQI